MIKIGYKPGFIRQWKKLPPLLRTEVKEKIELFKDSSNHENLKVHKLHGRFKNYYGFSVNYQTRVVFQYVGKKIAELLDVDDHDVYK